MGNLIASKYERWRGSVMTAGALLLAIAAALGSGRPALAAQHVITSSGPLTNIYISDTLNCQEVYRTDVQLANAGATDLPVLLYRAGDCFLQSSDFGFGRVGPGGAIACTADTTATSRIEQWVPITSGSHYYETFYNTGWHRIGLKTAFPDTCDCATR